jgi:hypothetical protein
LLYFRCLKYKLFSGDGYMPLDLHPTLTICRNFISTLAFIAGAKIPNKNCYPLTGPSKLTR